MLVQVRTASEFHKYRSMPRKLLHVFMVYIITIYYIYLDIKLGAMKLHELETLFHVLLFF